MRLFSGGKRPCAAIDRTQIAAQGRFPQPLPSIEACPLRPAPSGTAAPQTSNSVALRGATGETNVRSQHDALNDHEPFPKR